LQQHIISDLRELSENLKKVEQPRRKDFLIIELQKINNFIDSQVRSRLKSTPKISLNGAKAADDL
jgi:hypothetical protein